jgi:DNA-binding MarR family transcriptional regulator
VRGGRSVGAPGALRGGMHPTFFSVKRVHLSLVAWQRVLLRSQCGTRITPARFDLMRVIAAHGGSCARWRLVKVLGVSGTVVSRMVKALERDGLVRRSREPHDRRCVLVSLTGLGRFDVDQARLFTEGPALESLARRVFSFADGGSARQATVFAEFLQEARVNLRDRAPLPHPWVADRLFDEHGYFRLGRPSRPLAISMLMAS